MGYFAVNYTYSADHARQDELRPQHRAYLQTLFEQGHLFASGPLPEAEPKRALLLFRADDVDQVAGLLDADPFRIHGLVAERSIHLWNPVIGALADLG